MHRCEVQYVLDCAFVRLFQGGFKSDRALDQDFRTGLGPLMKNIDSSHGGKFNSVSRAHELLSRNNERLTCSGVFEID